MTKLAAQHLRRASPRPVSRLRMIWSSIQASRNHHLSSQPDVSWFEFAKTIFECTGREIELTAIQTSDYPTPAKRPANSRLDCASTKLTFDIDRPIWKNDLKEILQDLGEIQWHFAKGSSWLGVRAHGSIHWPLAYRNNYCLSMIRLWSIIRFPFLCKQISGTYWSSQQQKIRLSLKMP